MVKDITDDIRQVFRRHHFLLVTQFDDLFGDLTHGIVVHVDSQRFQVHADIRLAGSLSEGIFADTAETFGDQVVAIQVVFAIAIGMDAGTLREDMFTDDRTVRSDMDAGIGLNQAACGIDLLFPHAGLTVQMVFYHGDHTAERCISRPFAQAVDRGVDTVYSCPDCRIDIGYRQVVIVVGMEIKMKPGIMFEHLFAELVRIARFRIPNVSGSIKRRIGRSFNASISWKT